MWWTRGRKRKDAVERYDQEVSVIEAWFASETDRITAIRDATVRRASTEGVDVEFRISAAEGIRRQQMRDLDKLRQQKVDTAQAVRFRVVH